MDNEQNKQLGELIAAISAGDCGAIDKIYEKIGKVMYSVARIYLKEPTDAEDIVHDALLKIVFKAKKYRRDTNAYAWINTIVKNAAKDALKGKRKKEAVSCDTAFLGEAEPLEEEDIALIRGFDVLSETERDLIIYKYWYGLSLSEIAGLLNLAKSTVEYRVEIACEKLKKYYGL